MNPNRAKLIFVEEFIERGDGLEKDLWMYVSGDTPGQFQSTNQNQIGKLVIAKRNVLLIAVAASLLFTTNASAGNFRRVKYFDGTYLLGVCTLEEFEEYAMLYPGIDEPVPPITFYTDGTCDIGTEFATYTKRRGVITIDYIPPANSPFATVQYVLYRDSGNRFWGEILFDGRVYGIMQGRLTN